MVGTVKKLGPPLVGTVKEEEDKSRALSVSRLVLVFWTLSLSLWQANTFVRVTEFVLLSSSLFYITIALYFCIVFTLVSFCCLLKPNSFVCV